jgi:hypothetical protein
MMKEQNDGNKESKWSGGKEQKDSFLVLCNKLLKCNLNGEEERRN